MQTLHQVNNHVVHKMQTTFSLTSMGNDIQKVEPHYFLSDNLPLKESSYLKIKHDFKYQCTSCNKPSKKIYSGFCYLCLIRKPEADTCILSPNRCHYMKGTCRAPQFGDKFCYQPHYLYLAFTDKYKVGLTRENQMPTRWIDQGATLASPFIKTHSRHQAGMIEKFLTQKWADKSNWQNMLKIQNEHPTIHEFREELNTLKNWILEQPTWKSDELRVDSPSHLDIKKEILFLPQEEIFEIIYPLKTHFPPKIQTHKLDASPSIDNQVIGIKGQYIILDNYSAINIRNHIGFIVDIECNG